MQVGAVRAELRAAAAELRERGLAHAACWAAEQLAGLRQDADGEGQPAASPPQPSAAAPDPDALLLAKAYCDAQVQRRPTGSAACCVRIRV